MPTEPSRVTLRAFREEDAQAPHPIFADRRAMRFWSTPPHATLEQTRDYVRATMAAKAAGEGDDQVVLHEGRVIGKAGLWDNEEIGFILAPEVWGRGGKCSSNSWACSSGRSICFCRRSVAAA